MQAARKRFIKGLHITILHKLHRVTLSIHVHELYTTHAHSTTDRAGALSLHRIQRQHTHRVSTTLCKYVHSTLLKQHAQHGICLERPRKHSHKSNGTRQTPMDVNHLTHLTASTLKSQYNSKGALTSFPRRLLPQEVLHDLT